MFEKYPDIELMLAPLDAQDVEELAPLEPINLPLESLDIIYLYGLSSDYLHLEEWLNAVSSRHLIFLEDDLSNLKRLSQSAWAKKMLAHPQVHLKFLYSPVDSVLESLAREFPSERIAVETRRKKNKVFKTIQLALLRKTVLWNSLTSEHLSGHLLHRNILSNFEHLPKSFYVNQMKDAFKNKPAIICGAGPSLSTVIEDLRSMSDKAIIMGCGSALSSLSHFNIKPHFGVAIDPNARERECLSGCTFRDLPLIYGNRLYPKVFELFDGPFGYLRSPTGSPLEKAIEEELGLTEDDIGTDLGREALSVTTLALSIACFWGCNPIILAGVDLAYSGTAHYAKGVPVHAEIHKQETRAGEQFLRRKGKSTLVKWVMEQETIDSYTKLYPHITFLNATGRGLGFPSIPYKPLSAISLSPISTHFQPISTPVTQEKLHATLGSFRSSFERCLEYARKLQQEVPESGKGILYEEELNEEKAYQLTLKPALASVEKVYALNITLPFSRQKWKFLEEMTEEYLQLF